MKKRLLSIFVFPSLLLGGCNSNLTNNDSNSTDKVITDISSIDGTFYLYFSDTKQARVPGVELPYSYSFNYDVEITHGHNIEYVKIKDSEVIFYHLSGKYDRANNKIDYIPESYSADILQIGERYFCEGTEFVFSNEMIYLDGNIYVSEEYCLSNGIELVQAIPEEINSYHTDYLFDHACFNLYSSLTELVNSLSMTNSVVELPSKIDIECGGIQEEVKIEYNKIYNFRHSKEPVTLITLNNNTLTANEEGYLEYILQFTLSYKDQTKVSAVQGELFIS